MKPFAPMLLLVAGCSDGETANGAAAPDDRIDCRVGAAADFERSCTMEAADGGRLIVRKPDGGFRRLLRRTSDGFAAADGAEAAHVTRLRDGRFEVEIGGDRFRLPAPAR